MMDMVPPASLDGKDAGQFEDHVHGAGPAAQLSDQLNPDHLGALELPGDGHHIHSVGAAQTDTETAQTNAIEGVRVCADHQQSCKFVLVENSKTDSASDKSSSHHFVNNHERGINSPKRYSRE